jgi:hypothetical protein
VADETHSTPGEFPSRRTGGIVIVGPCAAGKSTLAAALTALGYRARQIAQEHSYVPDMWLRISQPDFLLYLDADHATCSLRKHLDWTVQEYEEQGRRLAHARAHCDLYVDTVPLTPEAVVAGVLQALERAGVPREGLP